MTFTQWATFTRRNPIKRVSIGRAIPFIRSVVTLHELQWDASSACERFSPNSESYISTMPAVVCGIESHYGILTCGDGVSTVPILPP